jgi:hypothetical protein
MHKTPPGNIRLRHLTLRRALRAQAAGFEPARGLRGRLLPLKYPHPAPPAVLRLLLEVCERRLVYFVLSRHANGTDVLPGTETRGSSRDSRGSDIDRQLLHLENARPVLVDESGAVKNREGNYQARARPVADHQPIGIAMSRDALAEAAPYAQVRIPHRRSVFDLQFAHDRSSLIRYRRRLLTGEQAEQSRRSATELREVIFPVGIEPTTTGFPGEVTASYTTGFLLVLDECIVNESQRRGTSEKSLFRSQTCSALPSRATRWSTRSPAPVGLPRVPLFFAGSNSLLSPPAQLTNSHLLAALPQAPYNSMHRWGTTQNFDSMSPREQAKTAWRCRGDETVLSTTRENLNVQTGCAGSGPGTGLGEIREPRPDAG